MTGAKDVDLFVEGAAVLTMRDGEIWQPGALAVSDGQIVYVGPAAEGRRRYRSDVCIGDADSVVLPGLINAHTHLGLHFMGTLWDEPGPLHTLYDILFPLEAAFDEESLYFSALTGAWDAVRSGVTTVCDHFHFADSTAQAVHRIGLRALIADKVIEFRLENPPRLRRGASRYSIDYDRKEAERRLDRNVRFIERWRGDALVTPCLGPHAPDTLTTDILIECGRLAESLNVKLLMHVAQSIQELNQVESKSQGCSGSVRYLDRLGLLSPRLHAAHCVLIDDDELNAMETSGMSVAFCPVILTGCGMFPPVGAFLQKGIPLSFGTDCFSMNALDQMRYALYATNFTRGGSDPPLSAERLLRMATCEAAECVGLSDTVGTLEVGKRADILVLDFKDASVLASVNYAEAVAYYATSRNVASTIVDGRLVYHAGRLCLVGEDELYRDAKAAWQGWIGRNRPLLERSGLIRRVSAI